MNREIKFRAWDGEKMICTILLTNGQIIDRFENIMQFTGLKDKKGIDIYEGDIIKRVIDFNKSDIREFIEKVIFDEASFCTLDIKKSDDKPSYLANYFCHSIEIIGNIHENPELIK